MAVEKIIDLTERVRDYPPKQQNTADEVLTNVAHRGSSANPHSTTAGQVGADTSAQVTTKANAARDAAKAYTDVEVERAVKAGAVNPRGAWDAAETYDTLDLTSHSGNSWYASEPTVAGEEPGVSAKWVNYAGGIDLATANAAYGLRVVFNGTDDWDSWDGVTGATAATDNGPALQAVLDGLAGTERVLVELPKTVNGLYFATGVIVPSNVHILAHAKLINNATQAAGNKLFLVKNVTDVSLDLRDVQAIATGDFTGGRNPQVAVSMEGTVDRVSIHGRFWDHQNFAIQYADADTNPVSSWMRDVDIKAAIGGECGPTGDGSGVNLFPRAQDGDAPNSYNVTVDVTVDVSRGQADRTQHGPQGFKANNLRNLHGRVFVIGGAVAGVALANGCQDIDLDVRCRKATRGAAITNAHNVATTPTRDITMRVSYEPDGVTNGDRYVAYIGEVDGVDLTVHSDKGDLYLISDDRTETARDLKLRGRCRNLVIQNPSTAMADIEGCDIDLTLVGDGAGSGGRASIAPANWTFSRSKLNLRLIDPGGAAGVIVGGRRNRIDVQAKNGNPTDNAAWPLVNDSGQGNTIGRLEIDGGNADWHYRRNTDGPAIIEGPLVGPAAAGYPIDLVGITAALSAPRVVWSTDFILSGAAREEWVWLAPQDHVLLAVLHFYTVASSADAGVNLRTGLASSTVSALHIATSASSQAAGTAVRYQNTADISNAAQRRVVAGDGVRVKSDGGKTGAGTVRFGLVLVPALSI